jgi:zinc transporter ZupT
VAVSRAARWSSFWTIPQPLLTVEAFAFALPFGLAFDAGAMVWMAFAAVVRSARGAGPERVAFP